MQKRFFELFGTLIPLATLIFVVAERYGVWDRVRGIDRVEEASRRFDLSHAPDASIPVRVGEPAWKPLLKLISKYSPASLPHDKEPRVVARMRAILGAKVPIGGPGNFIEWTAPGTPLLLIYKDWPGNTVPREDYRIIGTIGDLHAWIAQSKADFHSDVVDILLALTSSLLGIALWRLNR